MKRIQPKGGQEKRLKDLETTCHLKIGISIDQPINDIFIEASGEVYVALIFGWGHEAGIEMRSV